MGIVTGSGLYYIGDTATLTATPAPGYAFTEWDNGETDSVIYVVVTSDIVITASFTPVSAVSDIDCDGYNVYSSNGYIYVVGAQGCTVTLYDSFGRIVAQNPKAESTEKFDVPLPGVYFVCADRRKKVKSVVVQ